MNLSVLAINVECDDFSLKPILRGEAAKFFPHISIVPRFVAGDADFEEFAAYSSCEKFRSVIELKGPKRVGHSLEWYECVPESLGYSELLAMHLGWVSKVYPSTRLFNLQHCGRGYRPHMTIRSNEHGGNLDDAPSMLRVRAKELVLYNYCDLSIVPAVSRSLCIF